jgi:hypothetical protein
LSDARTKLGKGRVLARLGQGGCNKRLFNILLQAVLFQFGIEQLAVNA